MAAGEKIYIADKETLDKIYNMLATEPVYGFIEHNAILAPGSRIEYIGANKDYEPISVTMGGGFSLKSWADFPVLKANKPYMVHADGTPDYRLKEDDYTKKEDGTASDVANANYNGGAFSWLMKIYKREYMAGDDRYVLFRFEKADGFEPVGFLDPDNKELEGAWIPMFYGSILGATGATPKMVSLSGLQPTYSNTTDKEKTAITNFSSRARFFGGPLVETIIDLLIMFAKTTELQTAYGCGNMSGYDASLSPTYGVKQNNVVGGGQFYGTSDGKSLNKIFHSIVLGSYQQWMRDPYEIVVNGRVKVSKNYAYDVTGASYTDTGITAANRPGGNGWDYPHKYQAVPGYGAIPVAPYNGSTSTGGCDGLYRNENQSGMTAVALRFGRCDNGRAAGPRARAWTNVAGSAAWDFGAAVLLQPPVGVAA
ncbi:MAG: hypothetical protein NC548_26775 [Lachnospiraceae bacterium]|nr:hypothetical protein [Lachnospiraceae bacterium]